MTNDQKLHSIALLVCTKISQFKLSSFYSNRLPPLTIHIKIRKLFCARITQPFSVPKIVLRKTEAENGCVEVARFEKSSCFVRHLRILIPVLAFFNLLQERGADFLLS